jgi:hypothetical protein
LEKGNTSADNGKVNEAKHIRQPGSRKQVNKNMAPQVRFKMVSSYDPCNERVTG